MLFDSSNSQFNKSMVFLGSFWSLPQGRRGPALVSQVLPSCGRLITCSKSFVDVAHLSLQTKGMGAPEPLLPPKEER